MSGWTNYVLSEAFCVKKESFPCELQNMLPKWDWTRKEPDWLTWLSVQKKSVPEPRVRFDPALQPSHQEPSSFSLFALPSIMSPESPDGLKMPARNPRVTCFLIYSHPFKGKHHLSSFLRKCPVMVQFTVNSDGRGVPRLNIIYECVCKDDSRSY